MLRLNGLNGEHIWTKWDEIARFSTLFDLAAGNLHESEGRIPWEPSSKLGKDNGEFKSAARGNAHREPSG
jgi:hypothetical protein